MEITAKSVQPATHMFLPAMEEKPKFNS